MISVAEAEARIIAAARPLDAEIIDLNDAAGRVLAADVISRRTHPPRDVSAMDGYAVRAADVAATPARLTVTMRVAAGEAPAGAIGPGEAARIFTGAALPDGADAIVIQENADADGDAVIVREPSAHGRHVRRAGYDFRQGDVLATAGRRLTAADVGLIAAGNVATLSVRRRPRVAFLASGDELVAPGGAPQGAEIIASTGLALAAMLTGWGATPIDLGIARDDGDDIRARATPGLSADLLVTLGGASVGDYDLVQPALEPLGLTVDFWKIAMRPGKPLMFGAIGGVPVIGLPGNPVSALVCARLFIEPLVRTLGGETWAGHRLVAATLASPLPANDSRQDHPRAAVSRGGASLTAHPFPTQDSGQLSAYARADALIVRPPHDPARAAGDGVWIIPLTDWL